MALLTFNLGVEAGQLMFVGAVLLIYAAVRSLITMPLQSMRGAAAYVIGVIAAVWFIDRVTGFLIS